MQPNGTDRDGPVTFFVGMHLTNQLYVLANVQRNSDNVLSEEDFVRCFRVDFDIIFRYTEFSNFQNPPALQDRIVKFCS